MSSYFSICLIYDIFISSCKQEFGRVVFADSPVSNSLSLSLTNPKVQSLTSSSVSRPSSYKFEFTTTGTYGVNNTIRITFPPGYTSTVDTMCQMEDSETQIIKSFIWPDQTGIECQLINQTISSNEIITIVGIYNPNYAGVFGNTAEGFVVEILKDTSNVVLEELLVQMTVTILPGEMIAIVSQENKFVKSKTKYTFYLTLQNSLGPNDHIQIKLDKTWLFYEDECEAISGFSFSSGSSLVCQNDSDSTYSYLKVNNFESALNTSQIVFSVYVKTPLLARPTLTAYYPTNIITSNTLGVMDEANIEIYLNATFGTYDMISINAITANSKLGVGKTGPLELTYFLNYELPQTNVLTEGLLKLKIIPPIDPPVYSINGVLKCYFFNTIPAETCTWDNTISTDYTLVTIKTPETTSFQYSEIPITITTEGAIDEAHIGITIADKVTRYRFEVEFYKQDNYTTPTEVFYSEYVADAISLDFTPTSLSREIDEYTALKIEYTNPYLFSGSILSNIRLKIEFVRTYAFSLYLGYTADEIIKRFPCVFYYGSTYDSSVRCDLYNTIAGPYSSLVSTNKGPYIIVYGFSSALLAGTTYKLMVGKLLIGDTTSLTAQIRLSILQETPEMLTKYIELYVGTKDVFSTVAKNIANPSLLAVTVTPVSPLINTANAVHTGTFTTPTTAIILTYEYDMESTPSFPTRRDVCSASNNDCFYFGYPVNWIIEEAASFPASITNRFSITNGKYGGTFAGRARTFSSGMLTLFKGTFGIVYNPYAITTASFVKESNLLYKGADVYYTVSFVATHDVPKNGFIRLIFSNEVTVSAQPYCESSISLFVAEHGILCLNENTDTLKIYNLGAMTTGSTYTFIIRLVATLTSGSPITPTVTIRTYYNVAIDYSAISEIIAVAHTSPLTNNVYVVPSEFTVESPKYTSEIPRVNYIGSFSLEFTANSAQTGATSIVIDFLNHRWNGGIWTTPNQNLNDPLVCFINSIRVRCSYTLSPLKVTLTASNLASGSVNSITITTEYLPINGILHPSEGGDYMSILTFYNAFSTLITSTSFYHKVLPSKLRRFTVSSAVYDRNVENMFTFEIQVGPSLYPIRSKVTGAVSYSRIFIEFPTVDGLGNSLFLDNLGGYTKTGEYVGCHMSPIIGAYIDSPTDDLKCRLIKSEEVGAPTMVEVLNFGEFNSTNYLMRLYIAKVFNPVRAVVSIPLSIRIIRVISATNNVYEYFYDTYDLFMNSQVATPVGTNLLQNCNAIVNDFTEDNMEVGQIGWIRFYPKRIGTVTNPYYYVIKLPADFKPVHIEKEVSGATSSCGTFTSCITFPDIGYIVIYGTDTDTSDVRIKVQFPSAISQNDYNFNSLVWQDGRYLGIVETTMNSACHLDFRGTILSYSLSSASTQYSSALENYNKRYHRVIVTFTANGGVPAGGSIQIIWGSPVTAIYPHCKSMISLGSTLTAIGAAANGEIGCMIQSSNSWVITEFETLARGSVVKIAGYVDYAGSSGQIVKPSEIITYNNTHATTIRPNGFIIDYLVPTTGLTLSNYNSMNVDSEISLIQTLPLRVSYRGPLEFKFKLSAAFPGPNIGKIMVRLPKNSVYGLAGGFATNTSKLVCQIKNILTHEEFGCIMNAATEDLTVGEENIQVIMTSGTALPNTETYKLLLTSYAGTDGSEGLFFPTVAGNYKIDVSFETVSGANNYNIHDQLYLEVYGTAFTSLSIQSFITFCAKVNLVWVKFAPTTTIAITDSLIIEIPTKSTAGMTLFADDLGLSIADGASLPIDVISLTGLTDATKFMTCKLFHGDQGNGKSVRIVCGGFTTTITSAKVLHFGFKVMNPTVTPQASIPFFIYSLDTNLMKKTNFNMVENAVYLRNTLLTDTTISGQGYFGVQGGQMQVSNTYIEFAPKNRQDITDDEHLVLFFEFNLRKTGLVTDGCKNSGGTSILGNAYYHENLKAIVCHFIYVPTLPPNPILVAADPTATSATLRIEGFYTPQTKLSASEKLVKAYHFYSYELTYESIFTNTNGFPDLAPKQNSPTTATFSMTPVHQTIGTQYIGTRDDYTFDFVYSTDAANLVDISYVKLIALLIPTSPNFVLLGGDCYEGIGSEIEIAECWTEPSTNVIWIKPILKTTDTSDLRIVVTTTDLAIRNPLATSAQYDDFIIRYYSWNTVAQPVLNPFTDDHCFLYVDSFTTNTVISFTSNPTTTPTDTFSYFNIPHQRYYEETPYSSINQYAPFEFVFRPDQSFPTATGANYHSISVYFGTSFTSSTESKVNDLEINRPVCYLGNYRVKDCEIDYANYVISMSFQFALTAETDYHVLFSQNDPRDPDLFGFLSTQSISNIRVSYALAATPTAISYTESEQFPSLYTFPTGVTLGPHRGISLGKVEYGHRLANVLNAINFELTFNRTDITGLVFEISLIDGAGTLLYSTSTVLKNAFMGVGDGGIYPCGNNGFSAGGKVKCFLKSGDIGQLTIPTQIIMTDFTYTSKMNCRFIFINPDTTNAYFSVKVRAFGGTKSSSHIYGNKYMGEWDFSNIFQVSATATTPTTYDTPVSRLPSKSPWRKDTSHYVFSRNSNIVAGRMSIAEVLTYDSSSSNDDKEFAIATLGSTNDYDDLLMCTKIESGVTKKYSYFIRTWAASTNNQESATGGWALSYIKMKFYAHDKTVYWCFGETDVEEATNTFATFGAADQLALENVGSSPSNTYFDQNNRIVGSGSSFVMELDITSMVEAITDLEYRNEDNFALSILFESASMIHWSTISSCFLLGGLDQTSSTLLPTCVPKNSTNFFIKNFQGFVNNPKFPTASRKRISILFRTDALSTQASTTRTISVALYANYDAFNNDLQAISRKTGVTLLDNCYTDPIGGCNYAYGTSMGSFTLQTVTAGSMTVSFQPSGLSFGTNAYSHSFTIEFFNFEYSSSCSATGSVTISDGFSSVYASSPSFACAKNKITVTLGSAQFRNIWSNPSDSIVSDDEWDSGEVVTISLTITSTSTYTMYHDYIFALGLYAYTYTAGPTTAVAVRMTDQLSTLNTLATGGVTITTISDNIQGATELIIRSSSTQVAIGSTTSGYLLLAEFSSSSAWTDPFLSYTNSAEKEQDIVCKCISSASGISIASTTPFTDAKCKRRMPSITPYSIFAIVIDMTASAGDNIQCHFPEFLIKSGMSVTVNLKAIIGDSYIPKINSGSGYDTVYETVSNTLTFAATPMPTAGTTFIETPTLYSTPQQVASSITSHKVEGTWSGTLSTPWVYVNFRKAGPIPTTSYCYDTLKFLECRVYSSINVIVAKLRDTTALSFEMSVTGVTYPKSQWSITTDYNAVVYIGSNSNTWVHYGEITRTSTDLEPIDDEDFFVYPDLYGSQRATFKNILVFSINLGGETLYRYEKTGSKGEITYSSISTTAQICQIWVQNEPTSILTCVVSTSKITFYSERVDFTTSNVIFITVGITNPDSNKEEFTLVLYNYYYSATRYSEVIRKTVDFTIDNTFSTNTEISKTRVKMYPFRSRVSNTANAPFRFWLQPKSTVSYNTATPTESGAIKIKNFHIAFSTTFLCYFKEFNSMTNLLQRTERKESWSSSCEPDTVDTDILIVIVPKTLPLSNLKFYELIVMPIGINSAGCTPSCPTQSGFGQTNFEEINIVAYSNPVTPTTVSQQVQKMYEFEGKSKIVLQSIYILSVTTGKTSLYINFITDITSAADFPYHYIEIIFWDLTILDFAPYSNGDAVPCQLSSTFKSITGREKPACILNPADFTNNHAKIKIINLGDIDPSVTYWLTLDDINLPTPNTNSKAQKFDMSIVYMGPSNTRYESFFRELFVIDNTNTVVANALPITMTTPTQTSHGFLNLTGFWNFNWPFDTTTPGVEYKFVVDFKGGYSATWIDLSEVKFFVGSTVATLLWMNEKLNKFVLTSFSHTASAIILEVSGLNNPYPYQKTAYELTKTVDVKFYKDYQIESSGTLSQPLYSIFTKSTTSLINVLQSSPSNVIDTFPLANQIGSGGTGTLRLIVKPDVSVTAAVIQKRDLNIVEIKFTSGVLYLEECRAVRNDVTTTYTNEKSVCQTKFSTNWKVLIYNYKESKVDIEWLLHIVGKFSAASLSYTINIMDSLQTSESETSYTASISNYYSASKSIPTTLSFLNRKYVNNYYENNVKFIEAVASQTTNNFKFRFTINNAFDGDADVVRIYLNSGSVFVNQNSPKYLICQILPAVSAEKDFSIGYYAECSRNTVGSNYYYELKGPMGGWIAGDYLLQISEPNPITSSFSGPTTPITINMQILQIVDGFNNAYDSFLLTCHQFFTSVTMLHSTTTVNDYDTISITFVPKSATVLATATTETILTLDIAGNYYEYDGGLISVYASDSKSVNSGFKYSQVVSNQNNNEVTTVMFAQYTEKYGSLRLSLTKMNAYTAGVAYTWRIPLLKNPSVPSIPLRYNLTLSYYPSGQSFPIVINKHQCINEYITETSSSLSFTPTISATTRNVQDSNIAITINFGMNIAQWNSVIFKFDNKLIGIEPNYVSGGNTGNYDYFWFKGLNMMYVVKKSLTSVVTITLGSTYKANLYKTAFRIEWVRIMGSSNAPTMNSPNTLYKGTIATGLTLNHLTTLTSPSIAVVEGTQYQGSTVSYTATVTVMAIPAGGEIRIPYDSTRVSMQMCTLNLVSNSDELVPRCIIDSSMIRLRGFSAITANTVIEIKFSLKSIVAITSLSLILSTYGIDSDTTTLISTEANSAKYFYITHSSSNFPTGLIRRNHVKSIYYSSIDGDNSYEIEGTLKLRAITLAPGAKFHLNTPLLSYGDRRMLIKPNTTAVEWTELIITQISATNFTFTVPPTYSISLSLLPNVEYIWKYTTTTASAANIAKENGLITTTGGVDKFAFEAHSGVVSDLLEANYYDFVSDPKPKVLTLTNRYTASGLQTILNVEFYTTVDILAGDWLELRFDTNNLLDNMFANDLENKIVAGEVYRLLDCLEYGGIFITLASSRMRCMMYYGDSTVSPPKPARLVIPMEETRSASTTPAIPNTVRFMISNLFNPSISGLKAGIELNLFRKCANTFNKNCSMYSARGWYVTTTSNEVYQNVVVNFAATNNYVLENTATHTFSNLPLTSSITTTDMIIITYPANFKDRMASSCTAVGYTCYSFPSSRMIMLIPTGPIATTTTNIVLTAMKNPYYQRAGNWTVVIQRSGVSSSELYKINPITFSAVVTSPVSGVSTSITLAPTQTPSLWLRNYANTAIIEIDNLYIDSRTVAFYVRIPSGWSFDSNYCNATFTGTQNIIYPFRFKCNRATSTILRLLVDSQDFTNVEANINVWSDLTIRVHAKFTIPDFLTPPTLYVTMPTTSGTIYAYSSVSTSENTDYTISYCSTTISISQHQIPIIGDIQFNQESFANRVAKVKNREVFYMLLNPTSQVPITQMVFEVPIEFEFPGVFSLDNCFMLGRQRFAQPNCALVRENGKALIKVTPSNYDNTPRIIQLGTNDVLNWFRAPGLPGDFYNMTVSFYNGTGELVEKQTVNIAPIYGEDLSIPNIVINNILDGNIAESIYEIQFLTGTLQIPPGAPTSTTKLQSELHYIFESYNSNNSTNVFKNDIGTNLTEGDEIGCVARSGLTVLPDKRIICRLHIGTNSTDKPTVIVTNYDFVDPAATILMSIGGVQALDQTQINTISVAVKIFYPWRNSSTYLYMPTAGLPKTTNNVVSIIWNSYWDIGVTYSGANVVRTSTNLRLSLRVPYTAPYAGYSYSSSGIDSQFILLRFTPKIVIDPYTPLNITCATCSSVDVFYPTGIVRIRHTQTITGSTAFNFDLSNFPTSAYSLTNKEIKVNVEIYDGFRLTAYKNITIASRTVQVCVEFSFIFVSASSLLGGQSGVSYTFEFVVEHFVPPKGSISIGVPDVFPDLFALGATCELVGFEFTTVYCLIRTPHRADIYLNGSELSLSQTYQLIIKGVQNPNEDISSTVFTITSYYDELIYEEHQICSITASVPTITLKTIQSCSLSWSNTFANQYFKGNHIFTVNCNDNFKANSLVYIKLPIEFNSNNTESQYACYSLESTTLVKEVCNLGFINGSFVLYTQIRATSQYSFSISIDLVNPLAKVYSATATVLSQNILYAQTTSASITITSNSFEVGPSSSVSLFNSPQEAGLLATYIFKISPISTFTPTHLSITFPSEFFINSTSLSVALATSTNGYLFNSLTYSNVERLFTNVSIDGVNLDAYIPTVVENRTVLLNNLTSYLSNSEWTYAIVKGVKNPVGYMGNNFDVVYYTSGVGYRIAEWEFKGVLSYNISHPPNYIAINSVVVSDYDILAPAVYKFTFSAPPGKYVGITGKKLSYIVMIPAFYKNPHQANVSAVCKFSELLVESNCTSYESQIIVTETFTSDFNTLTLEISTILNPSAETFCNTTDPTLLSHSFFKIRVFDIVANSFLYESASIVDGSNCLRIYAIRVPISVECPLQMVAGLSYNITYGISIAASNLKIRATSTANGFTFTPQTVEFEDYSTLSKSISIYLRSDMTPGYYIINFSKFESETNTHFKDIFPVTVEVLSPSSSVNKPSITIPSMSISTIGYPVYFPIVLSTPVSSDMSIAISIVEEEIESLESYSLLLANFSLEPRRVRIIPQVFNFSFSIYQGMLVVPPPITLKFELASFYEIIHNLTTPIKTVCFDLDNTYNVLYPPLRITLTDRAELCNLLDVGRKFTNVLLSNSSLDSSAALIKPIIINMTKMQVGSTTAVINVYTRSPGTIYYFYVDAAYPLINSTAEILSPIINGGGNGSVVSVAQQVDAGVPAPVNNLGVIKLSGLYSTTNYRIYAVMKSELGISEISSILFSTTLISKGVLMKLQFSTIVSNLVIVKALEKIMRISPLRIKILTSPYLLALTYDPTNPHANDPAYIYEVVIAPDSTNDTPSPLEIVQNFLQNETNRKLFDVEVPSWEEEAEVEYYELRSVKPVILTMPHPEVINIYNATFTIKFWERANIYAILVQDSSDAEDSLSIANKSILAQRMSQLSNDVKVLCPSSSQIRNGMNINNVQQAEFKRFIAITNERGDGSIFFDDLQPGSVYSLYITSSSYLPYEPTILWGDEDVIRIQFETLRNPNLMRSNRYIDELKVYEPKLGDAIERFIKNQDKKNQKATTTQITQN